MFLNASRVEVFLDCIQFFCNATIVQDEDKQNTNYKLRVTSPTYELRVQVHELWVQIQELRVQIHELTVQIYEFRALILELRVQIHELRVQIHKLGD